MKVKMYQAMAIRAMLEDMMPLGSEKTIEQEYQAHLVGIESIRTYHEGERNRKLAALSQAMKRREQLSSEVGIDISTIVSVDVSKCEAVTQDEATGLQEVEEARAEEAKS